MNTYTKPFFKFIALTALVAVVTGFMIPIEIIVSDNIKAFTKFVGSIFPCVSVMSEKAINPARAELTWAVQWLFFPLYLCLLFVGIPIRDRALRESIVNKFSKFPNVTVRRLVVIFGICFLGHQILVDFRILEGESYLRGTTFEGDVSHLSRRFRAPFTSNIGMALNAWLFPMIVAVYYWAFFLWVANFKLYMDGTLPAKSIEESENTD